MREVTNPEVIVVGGGLAGLTAAAVAARAGAEVVLLDARSEPGGRARTTVAGDVRFNQGPHALYRNGAGARVLAELGVRPRGRVPSPRRGRGVRDGRLLTVREALPPAAWGDVRRALGPDGARHAVGRTTAEWLDHCRTPAGRDALAALVRVTSYLSDVDHVDAAATVRQLRTARGLVLYLDGGWRQLVDGLLGAAQAAGVEVRTGQRVTGVAIDGGRATVTTDDGELHARAVVLAAGGPGHADALLGGASGTVSRWAREARPVVAACLDLATEPLPGPRRGLVLGLDRPWYLADHAATAQLARPGRHLLHAMRYLGDGDAGADHRADLEALVDLVHPAWRDRLVDLRWGRQLVVAHDRPRPGVEPGEEPVTVVADLPGAFVAGDWITGDGMLADAALASGQRAGWAAAAHAQPGTLAAGVDPSLLGA